MKFIQVLYLAAALSVAPAGMMWAQNTSGYFMHTVTKGQSLYSISVGASAVSLSVICNMGPMGPPSKGFEDEVNNAQKQLIHD